MLLPTLLATLLAPTASLPTASLPQVGSPSGPFNSAGTAEGDVDIVSLEDTQLMAWVSRKAGVPDVYTLQGIWLDETGAALTSPFLIWENTVGIEIRDVATGTFQNTLGSSFLVGWSYDNGSDFDIALRALDPLETSLGSILVVADDPGDEVEVDLTKTAETSATLVYASPAGIQGHEIRTNFGQISIGAPFSIATQSNPGSPSITRFGIQRFVTWIRRGALSNPLGISGRSWYNTTPTSTARTFSVLDDTTVSSVDCASAGGDEWMVVYTAGSISDDVRCRRVVQPQGPSGSERLDVERTLAASTLGSRRRASPSWATPTWSPTKKRDRAAPPS